MLEQRIIDTKIRYLELDPPVRVETGFRIGDVLATMRDQRKSCVLVCHGDRCTGIFTERDFLNKIFGKNLNLALPVENFMSPNPKTLTPDDTVGQAIQLMHEHGFRNVPLVDPKGNCAGLVQIRNIIDFLAELYPEEVLNRPPRPEQKFDSPDGA